MKIKHWLCVLLIFHGPFLLSSQIDSSYFLFSKDTMASKTRIIEPLIDVLSINLLVNRVDVWIRDRDWAKVNIHTWSANLKSGFQPDNDQFTTNFLGHPVHGSWYYNAARSNGHSYWTSIPYVMAGSLTWEFFGENEPASEIDFNTTTLGGVYLGELTNRLSASLFQNDNQRKFKLIRNATAIALNPTAYINAWIHGEYKAKILKLANANATSIHSFLSLGRDFPFNKIENKLVRGRLHINYNMRYGDFFKGKTYKPFDFFVLKLSTDVSFSKIDDPIYLNIISHAPIIRVTLGKKLLFGISQHYDFLRNDVFKLSTMSITTDLTYRDLSHSSALVSSIKSGFVVFGSTSSDVAQYLISKGDLNANRDYLYGRGLALELNFSANIKYLGRINASYNNWLIFIRRDARGTEMSQIFKIDYSYPIFQGFDLGLEFYHYRRKADFDAFLEFQNYKKRYFEMKIFTSYNF